MTAAHWRGGVRTVVLLALVICAGWPSPASGEYRNVDVESLRITFDSDWAPRTAPGYVPIRIDLTNLGEARVIEIVGDGRRFFRGSPPAGIRIRQAVRLARGARVRLTLSVPVYAENENIRFEIREGDRVLEGFNYIGFQSGVPAAHAPALIVADSSSPFANTAASWSRILSGASGPTRGMVGSTLGTTRGGPGPRTDFVLDPTRLPTNWLGFTSLRAVILRAHEWQQLDEDQKAALLTWTACGGDLLYLDGDSTAIIGTSARTGGPAPAVRAYLFGRIHSLTSDAVARSGLDSVLKYAERFQDSNWSLPANRASDWGIIAARGFRLLIPGVDGVPARAYLLILIAFSLLIGPVNYWLLWRRRQQVLFVLTAPAIAAIFILVLGVYVAAGEGLGVRGRAMTFTMLDQVRKQAVTRASVSMYAAGMAPAGGLRFARDVAVFPIGPRGDGAREFISLDLTETQQFSTGVLQARAPANVEQTGFRTARERVAISWQNGKPSVVNGLDATISALLYREGGRVFSLTTPLPSGGRAVLDSGAPSPSEIVPAELPITSRLRTLIEQQPDRSYLAVLERSPFWDPGLTRLAERGSFHLVFGWPEGQP